MILHFSLKKGVNILNSDWFTEVLMKITSF
jgi:hypothetical protein